MLKNLLGAAVIAAVGFAVIPASAAKMASCGDGNMQKTESATEAMADGPGKTAAQKEMALAEHAKQDGKMGACAMHLSNAMHPDSDEASPGGNQSRSPSRAMEADEGCGVSVAQGRADRLGPFGSREHDRRMNGRQEIYGR